VAKPNSTAQPPVSLEQAMDRLDAIVKEMELGALPLEDLITRYEEGVTLVKACEEKLTDAERRIRLIARTADDQPKLEEFDPDTP
jgi:exodeoxyribonuclease VII small subunit